MDPRTALKREYKENPPPAGIYKITNRENGKILVGKAMDVRGKLNGQRAQLRMGGHRNRDLQEDWNRSGADAFSFEVIDYLQQSADPEQDIRGELEALEELWLAKLEPYGEKGYNQAPGK